MSQYLPHSLPYQLKRLFDSGHATAGDVAWQLGISKEYIEFAAKGEAKVGRGLELNIRKVLAGYRRQYPELWPDGPPIRLVTHDTEPIATVDGTPRGVFEERECFHGKRVFKAIDNDGVCRARIEVCASDITTRSQEWRLKQRLDGYLNMVNPVEESVGENTS